jgi:hypothetical protein
MQAMKTAAPDLPDKPRHFGDLFCLQRGEDTKLFFVWDGAKWTQIAEFIHKRTAP